MFLLFKISLNFEGQTWLYLEAHARKILHRICCLKITRYLQYECHPGIRVPEWANLQSPCSNLPLNHSIFQRASLCLKIQVKDFFFATSLSTHLKELDYDSFKPYLYLVQTKLSIVIFIQLEDYLVICVFFFL